MNSTALQSSGGAPAPVPPVPTAMPGEPAAASAAGARVIPLPARSATPDPIILKAAAESLERLLASQDMRLRFSVDRERGAHRVVIQLVDGNGSVVRTIPPDKLMSIVSGMEELAGLLVDTRAG